MANIQESVTENNVSTSNSSEDNHVCDNCQSIFDANWKLERHKKNKKGCKKKLEDYKCTNCDKKYCNKYTLIRHLKKCVKNDTDDNETNTQEQHNVSGTHDNNANNLIAEFLKSLGSETNQLATFLSTFMGTLLVSQQNQFNQFLELMKQNINHSNLNTSNTTATSNINNGTINNVDTVNQVINNNIILPNVVYPFGYENINVLTDDEKLEILKDPNCIERVLGAIYSHNENKNL